MGKKWFVFIVLAQMVWGCANINFSYRKDDISPGANRVIESNQSNFLYKVPSEYSTDILVSLVRMNMFSAPSTKNIGEITTTFWLMGKKSVFNCDLFFSKLRKNQIKTFQEKMEGHPFICNDPNYDEFAAVDSFRNILSENINEHNAVDAHWAWFSATGNTDVLKRILNNYLHNPSACKRCIGWSFSSNAYQNPDVEAFLIEFMEDKTESEKQMLKRLVPQREKRNSSQEAHP